MKNNKLYLILFLVVAVLLLSFFYFKNNNKEEVVEPVVVQKNENRQFSRVTFFNLNKNIKSSLAIPEDWEGEYRMKDSGGFTVFSFIVDPLRSYEIFRIGYFEENERVVGSDENEIIIKNGNVFFYKINNNEEDINRAGVRYKEMLNDIDLVVDSFK